MSSFNELSQLTIEELNSVEYSPEYAPIILPAIISRGNASQKNFEVSIDTQMRVMVESEQVLNPTTNTYENNTSSLFVTNVDSFNYYGFTKYWLIKEHSAKFDQSKFDFANKSARSNLNKVFDADSYKGDGLNKGLISNVSTSPLTYTTGDTLFQTLVAKKNKFIIDNSLMNTDDVYMMVSGSIYSDLSLICLNGTKLVSQALADANIVVIYTPDYMNTTNRVDFVDFKGLEAIYGKLPQAISTIDIVRQPDSINKYAELYIGYQSVAIYKRRSSTVQSYLKE